MLQSRFFSGFIRRPHSALVLLNLAVRKGCRNEARRVTIQRVFWVAASP
jgi:hypothetical protein